MSQGSPPSLPYATGEGRRRPSRLVVASLLLSLLAPLAAMATVTSLDHDQVCPSCGGWAAGAAVLVAGALLIAAIWTLVRVIRLGATIISIIAGALAVGLSALFLIAAVGFYFAIQA